MDFSHVADELREYSADNSLQLMDLLDLSEASRTLLSWVIRQGKVNVTAGQTFTGLSSAAVEEIFRILVARDFLVAPSEGESYYQIRMVSRKRGGTILKDW
ncbi:MAG: hypothetical protein M1600_04255 [Firmicutes bacterium]|jgi:hypothetical protein|nr:hypothetical protein [Bacillota bacterium]